MIGVIWHMFRTGHRMSRESMSNKDERMTRYTCDTCGLVIEEKTTHGTTDG